MLIKASYQKLAVSKQQKTKRGIFTSFIFLLLLLLKPFSAYAGTETITYDYYNSRAVKSALYSTATSGAMISYSYDNSGNITGRTVDATPPDTNITSNSLNPSNSDTAGFGFTSTKAGSTFECKLDSEEYGACTSPKQYTDLTDGLHAFSVRAIDASGLPDPTPASYTWNVDTTNPSSAITYPSNSSIMANAVTIQGTASDIGSNVSKVEVSINGGAWAVATGTTSWTYNWSISADGPYTIQTRATDAAGNVEIPTAGITLTAYKRTPSSVTINTNNQLLINSGQFTVKGVNYSPTPIGDDPETTAPYGDYFTFTTTNTGIYNRDLPLLRELGSNTVRLLTWDNSADHHDFLDSAYNSGTNPIYVIAGFHINPGLDIDPASQNNVREQTKTDFREMIAANKNHPAILMWSIGNELNASTMYGSNKANLFSLINEMAEEAHAEDANHPVTTPLADEDLMNTISTYNSAVPDLDIWGANIYRGNSFGNLFTDFATASDKPLLVTEFGIDAYNDINIAEDQTTQATYASTLWYEIEGNSATAVGGVYKEYSDEWWMGSLSVDEGCPEADNPLSHGDCGIGDSSFPDAYDNFEWWGLMSIAENGSNPDIVSARMAYTALQTIWREDYTLTVNKTGTGSGTVTSAPVGINCGAVCSVSYDNGAPVTLTASPDTGSTFTGWSGDADCTDGQVTMSADKTCTANFSLLPGVTQLDAWTNIYSSSPNNTNATDLNVGNFAVGSGTQRVLLVSVVMETSTNSPIPVISAKYGGTALTSINMATDTNKEVVWMGYLTDAHIGSGSKALTITYSNGSNNALGLHVKWSSYTGVDQSMPVVSSGAMHTRSNSVTFGSTINYINNGMTVVVAGNQGSPATGTLSATPAFTAGTAMTTDGHTSMTFTTAKHTSAGSYASNTTVPWSGSTGHSGLVVVSLQPAVTNQPPAFNPATFSRADATVDVAYTGQTIAGAATDPESDPITYEKVSGPEWLTVASNGALGGTPTVVGNDSFVVRATATGGTADATLNITVVAAPSGVTQLDAWGNIYSSSPNNTNDTDLAVGSFAVGSGTQRVLLVSVVMETSTNSPIPVISAKYGGTALTSINMATDTNKEVVWMGYLTDAHIGSGSKALTITYSNGSNNAPGLHVKWSSYTGVDQSTPVVSSWAKHTREKTVTFDSTISYVNNGMTVVVSGNQGSPATGILSATPAFTSGAETTTDGHSSMTFTTAKHTADGSYASNTEVIWSGSTGHSGLVVVSLQP